jgi:hypothetical protein
VAIPFRKLSRTFNFLLFLHPRPCYSPSHRTT